MSRLSLLTNSALVIRVQMRVKGGSCGVSANENSCAHHVTWSPKKLWRSTSIFNLWDHPFLLSLDCLQAHPSLVLDNSGMISSCNISFMSFCPTLSTLCSQVVFHNIPQMAKERDKKYSVKSPQRCKK